MAGGAAPACGLDGGKHRVNPEIKAQRARGEPSGRAESRQGNGPGASSKPSRQASAAHPGLSRAFQAFHRPDRLKFLCARHGNTDTHPHRHANTDDDGHTNCDQHSNSNSDADTHPNGHANRNARAPLPAADPASVTMEEPHDPLALSRNVSRTPAARPAIDDVSASNRSCPKEVSHV